MGGITQKNDTSAAGACQCDMPDKTAVLIQGGPLDELFVEPSLKVAILKMVFV